MAADEATALSNIHLLLDTLESQRHSMVASLTGKEVSIARNICNVKIPGHNASAVPVICKEPEDPPLFSGSGDWLAYMSGHEMAAGAVESVAITDRA